MSRPIYVIANEIINGIAEQEDKSGKRRLLRQAQPHAEPYLRAMTYLSSVGESYGLDSGKSIVLYALSNLGTYRGEKARRLKAELKELVK